MTQTAYDLTQELGLKELSDKIGEMFEGTEVSFWDIVGNALSGQSSLNIKVIWESIRTALLRQAGDYKFIFASILILGIFSAFFAQFGQLFENKQIAKISYDVVFLMMVMILLKIMQTGMDTARESLTRVTDFSRLLIPTLCLSLGISSGSSTAFAFYELALLVIFLIEQMLLSLIVPMIYLYTLLAVTGAVSADSRMDGILRFTGNAIRFLLRLCATAISVFGVVQGMLMPAFDGVKAAGIQKLISVIPGIGGFINSASEVVYGSAVLVKNAVGVAGILLLILLCAAPIAKLFLITVSLKAAAALSGMIADARMNRCVEQVSEGSAMLLKTLLCAMALFIVTVAVIAVTTNRGF